MQVKDKIKECEICGKRNINGKMEVVPFREDPIAVCSDANCRTKDLFKLFTCVFCRTSKKVMPTHFPEGPIELGVCENCFGRTLIGEEIVDKSLQLTKDYAARLAHGVPGNLEILKRGYEQILLEYYEEMHLLDYTESQSKIDKDKEKKLLKDGEE